MRTTQRRLCPSSGLATLQLDRLSILKIHTQNAIYVVRMTTLNVISFGALSAGDGTSPICDVPSGDALFRGDQK